MRHKLFSVIGLLMLCASSVLAQQYNAIINLTDSTISITPYTNRNLVIYPMSMPSIYGPSVVMRAPTRVTTDNTGTVTINGQVQGLYKVIVLAPPMQEGFQYLITSNTPSTFSVSTNLAADSTATFPAGSVAWAAAVTDLRYAPYGSGGVNTNAVLGIGSTNWVRILNGNATNLLITTSTDPFGDYWGFDGLGFYDTNFSSFLAVLRLLGGPVPSVVVNGQILAEKPSNSNLPPLIADIGTPFLSDIQLWRSNGLAVSAIRSTGQYVYTNFTPNSVVIADSGRGVSTVSGGGANTFLQGTAPPGYVGLSLASAQFANQGTATTVLHGNASGNPSFTSTVENDFSFTDITTANASTSAHGLLPKGDNNANHFLNGQIAYTSIPDAALSANVDLLNANQTITGNKTFSGSTTFTGGIQAGGTGDTYNTNKFISFGTIYGPGTGITNASGVPVSFAQVQYFTNSVFTVNCFTNTASFVPGNVSVYLLCTTADSNTHYVAGDEISSENVNAAAVFQQLSTVNTAGIYVTWSTADSKVIVGVGPWGGANFAAINMLVKGLQSSVATMSASSHFSIITRVSSQ